MHFSFASALVNVPQTSEISANYILSRWRMCIELFGRLFLDDVGAEPHSVLNEIGRFDVKEAKFRRDMEKLRNNHQKDLCIEEVVQTLFLFSVFNSRILEISQEIFLHLALICAFDR